MNQTGELIFFCGKMGAGKSTLSVKMAVEKNAVLLSEDEWLESLYPNAISSLSDYMMYSKHIKPPMKKLIQSILLTGTNVVMDFPANTVSQRNWFRTLFAEVEAPHSLIYINLSDEECYKRVMKRRSENPQRAKTDTKEIFDQVTKHFMEPSTDEGFTIIEV